MENSIMHKVIETNNGSVHIIGNGHTRDIVYGYELTEKERSWWADLLSEDDIDNGRFFLYYGDLYFLGDFMSTHNSFYGPHPDWMKPFDGYFSEGFCGGVLVSYGDPGIDYGERIRVYRYY
jgi:hypothetical protein